jgi:hypothetical protein
VTGGKRQETFEHSGPQTGHVTGNEQDQRLRRGGCDRVQACHRALACESVPDNGKIEEPQPRFVVARYENVVRERQDDLGHPLDERSSINLQERLVASHPAALATGKNTGDELRHGQVQYIFRGHRAIVQSYVSTGSGSSAAQSNRLTTGRIFRYFIARKRFRALRDLDRAKVASYNG